MQDFFKNTANILGISRKIVSIGNTASKKKNGITISGHILTCSSLFPLQIRTKFK